MDSRLAEPERPDPTLSEDLGYRFRPLPIVLVSLTALLVAVLPFPGLSEPAHRTLVILVAAGMAVIVSEVTSNTASAALVVPVVLALSHAAGIDPVKPALAATVGCSFGFMLPVSTPPNALVYATGHIRIGEMVAAGALLDLVGVVLVAVWVAVLG